GGPGEGGRSGPRRRASRGQRIEGQQMLAVAFAQRLDERQLARSAEPRLGRAQPVPAVEARKQHRLAQVGCPGGGASGVLAPCGGILAANRLPVEEGGRLVRPAARLVV